MASFVPVARRADVQEGKGLAVEVKGRLIALFLYAGAVYAIDDLCPHMGASLAASRLCDDVVTCCWHGWRFRVTDGTWMDNPRSKTRAYTTKVEGDAIFVEVTW